MPVSSSTIQIQSKSTFSAEGSEAGAANKAMIGAFNPIGSGEIIEVRSFWAEVVGLLGTTEARWEFRKTTSLTAGTLLTIQPWDSSQPPTASVVRSNPTIADAGLYRSWVDIYTTATTFNRHVFEFANGAGSVKPITLREGEGFYVKHVSADVITYLIGLLFTSATN